MIVGERSPDGTYFEREIATPELHLAESLAANLPPDAVRGGRVGARLAVQDLLESSRFFTAAQVREADRRLEASGAETLSAVRRRIWRTIPKLLERGRIRTEAEYYLLIERLNDVDDPDLDSAMRTRCSSCPQAESPAT